MSSCELSTTFALRLLPLFWISFVRSDCKDKVQLVLGWTSKLQCQLQTGGNPTSPKWALDSKKKTDTDSKYAYLPTVRTLWRDALRFRTPIFVCDQQDLVETCHQGPFKNYNEITIQGNTLICQIYLYVYQLISKSFWSDVSYLETCLKNMDRMRRDTFFHISSWQNHREASWSFSGNSESICQNGIQRSS